MQTKTVTHGPGESLSVTVGEANVLMGMRHSLLVSDAQSLVSPSDAKESDAEKPTLLSQLEGDELAFALIRRYTWPNCKAAAVASSGFDHAALTFEEFCKLPEFFVYNWEQAVLELNAHWNLVRTETKEEEAEEKKDEEVSASE